MFELGLMNHWNGFMLGITEISISVPIYNEMSSLSLTGNSIPVLLSIGGIYILVVYYHFKMHNLYIKVLLFKISLGLCQIC